MSAPNTACTGQVGFVAIFKQFSGFEFILLPGRVHARPPASNASRWAAQAKRYPQQAAKDSQMDLSLLANQIGSRHFVYHEHEFGFMVITDVMNNWAEYYGSGEAKDNYRFGFRWLAKDLPDQSNPPAHNIIDVTVYEGETQERQVLSALTLEWVYRYWVHFDKIRSVGAERAEMPSHMPGTDERTKLATQAKTEILTLLKSLPLDNGLDFMAMLTVEWARRFPLGTFLDNIAGAGYTIPDGVNKNEYAARVALWFMATAFHWEHIQV